MFNIKSGGWTGNTFSSSLHKYELENPNVYVCLNLGIDTVICWFTHYTLCALQLPSQWLSLNVSIKQLAQKWLSCQDCRDLQTPLALWELVKTKQPWQPLTVSSGLCMCKCGRDACVFVCVSTTSLQKQREELGAERKNKRDNQWLMAFPQGHHSVHLTVKRGGPQGSSY